MPRGKPGGLETHLHKNAELYFEYLERKGYLGCGGDIQKRDVYSIFDDEFQPKYKTHINHTNLLTVLGRARLLEKNAGDKATVKFKQEKLMEIRNKTRRQPSQLDEPQVEALSLTKVYRNQQYALSDIRATASVSTSEKCLVCGITFKSKEEHEVHMNDEMHLLRVIWTKKRSFLAPRQNIEISLKQVDSIKSREMEHAVELVCKAGDRFNITLYVKSTDVAARTLDDVVCLYHVPQIECLNIGIPENAVLEKGKHIPVDFSVFADAAGTLTAPFIFIFRNVKRKNAIYALKEITVFVDSEWAEVLSPSKPYKPSLPPVMKVDVCPIVAGEPPPKTNSMLKIERPLRKYAIPQDLDNWLNKGSKNASRGAENPLKLLAEKKLCPDNYHKYFTLLLHIEEHQMSGDIQMYSRENEELHITKGKGDLLVLQMEELAENRPSVLRGDRIYVRHMGSKDAAKYEGIVHEVERDRALLGFHRSFRDKFVKNMKFRVDFSINRLPEQCQHRALAIAKEDHVINLVFPKQPQRKQGSNTRNLNWFNRDIATNEEQKQAILNIVAGNFHPAPYLVFGPPGTGKTVTMVEAIKQIWKMQSTSHILVTAPSNAAANLLAERLVEHIPNKQLLRMFSASYPQWSIPEKLKGCCNLIQKEFFYAAKEDIMEYRIVVVTLVTAGRLVSANFPKGHFTHVFIDESGHSVEPETLIPVMGILTHSSSPKTLTGRLIMAGDPQQLGPVLRSRFASECGLGMSFLERLMTTCDLYKKDARTDCYNSGVLTKLVKNFRSHAAILEIPNKMFYDGELKVAAKPEVVDCACQWEYLPKKGFPVIFHGVIGKDEREALSPSYFNRSEIDVVVNYIDKIFDSRFQGMTFSGTDIGIVTPYRRQVQKFRKVLEMRHKSDKLKKKWDMITVGSVEEFQGQERKVIIVSTVRSNPNLLEYDQKFRLGFLRSHKRFNVAITRAKSLLIVVGNPNILQYDKHWRELILFAQQRGGYKGVAFTVNPDAALQDGVEEMTFNLSKLTMETVPVDEKPQWKREK